MTDETRRGAIPVGREDDMNDYVSQTADIFNGMRLLIEGAIVLYEGDAAAIVPLIQKAGEQEALSAFDTIGKALYDLRQQVKALEAASRQAIAAHER